MAESLGGTGRRESGAAAHTLTIWNYVNEHPGVTRDELKTKALELDWIPRGYAHRFVAQDRNRQRDTNVRKRATHVGVAEVAATQSDQAVHSVVMFALRQMCRNGSVRRDEDGGYHAQRRPRVSAQVEARVRPRDEVMAGIALNEARRKLLAYGIDRLRQPRSGLPLDIRESLAKWLEAGQLVEHDID